VSDGERGRRRQVEEGQLLMTLEAMKMEVSVFAKNAGTLAELVVSPGRRSMRRICWR